MMVNKNMQKTLEKIDEEYDRYMKKAKEDFKKGKRNSHPPHCEGNLW